MGTLGGLRGLRGILEGIFWGMDWVEIAIPKLGMRVRGVLKEK